jgi:hypothetical protein
MRNTVKAVCILAIFTLAVGSILAKTGTKSSDRHESIVIVYKDGHRQNVDMADIARIEFKTPLMIVFKDGRQKNIPASDIARIEFESPLTASTPGRNHFLGKWKVGEGNGYSNFYITLEADGEALKSIGATHGTWTVVDGEARITWDDGWRDAIRKVGSKHEKLAYEPGKTFDDAPSNVTAAVNTEPSPI